MTSTVNSEYVSSPPLIPQFYAGREVFITGATGFIGKVLVQRLLSTCPDIGHLHLLMRIKRGESPEARLDKLKESPVFDLLRNDNPDLLKKLSIIPGDINKPDLGLTDISIADLNNVSLVFHLAATVNMREKLDLSAKINVIAPMCLLDVCDRLPNMAGFVHVSTAYCHAERYLVEETVYPLPRPFDDMVEDSLKGGQMTDAEVERFIYPKPNTYTFTKMLAETAIKNHGHKGYPVAIVRPTIVTSAVRDPLPGWVQGLNGPQAIAVGYTKGTMRVHCTKKDLRIDLIPVDICVDTLIAVAWETAVDNLPEVRVYNCSTTENPTNFGDLHDAMLDEPRNNPSFNTVWYPSVSVVSNKYTLKLAEFFLETIPLYFIEFLKSIFGKKDKRFNLIMESYRLMNIRAVLLHFTTHEFWFTTDNVRKLRARLSSADAIVYNIDPTTICWKDYYRTYTRGVGKYLIGEKDTGTPAAKKRLDKLLYVHMGVTLLFLVLAAWLVKRALLRAAAWLAPMIPTPLGAMCTQLVAYLQEYY